MKKNSVIALLAMVALSFGSCGNKSSEVTPTADTVTVDTVVVADTMTVDTVEVDTTVAE